KEYAKLLAARGASVVVNDNGAETDGAGSSKEPAQKTADEINDAGGTAVASFDTVGTLEGAQAIVDLAASKYGRVDILVLNAGIIDPAIFPEINLSLFESHMNVHFFGHVRLVKLCWPLLKNSHGNIVTISSSAILGIPAL